MFYPFCGIILLLFYSVTVYGRMSYAYIYMLYDVFF